MRQLRKSVVVKTVVSSPLSRDVIPFCVMRQSLFSMPYYALL